MRGKRKTIIRIVLFILVIILASAPAAAPFSYGDELTDKRDEYDQTKQDIKDAEAALKEGEKRSKELTSQIKTLENDIYKAQVDINVLTTTLNSTKERVTTVLTELEEIEKRLDTENEALLERLRSMYMNGDVGMISVLLGSASMTELITNMEMVKRVYQSDAELIQQLEIEYKDVFTRKEELVELKETLEKQKADLDSQKKALNTKVNSVSALKKQVEKNNDVLEAQIDAMNKEAEALKAEIIKLQSSGKYAGGKMCWPAKSGSRVTSPFGMRLHPILKKMKLHTGIDIGASGNMLAANSGKVIAAAYNSSYGYYIMIDHGGGIVTLYAHASKVLVKKGDVVKRGQVIGVIGRTGMATGVHLHFEVRVNGVYKNPLDYVTQGKYYYD